MCSSRIIFTMVNIPPPTTSSTTVCSTCSLLHKEEYAVLSHTVSVCLPLLLPKVTSAPGSAAFHGFCSCLEGSWDDRAHTSFINSMHLCESHEPVLLVTQNHGSMHTPVPESVLLISTTAQDPGARK